MSTFLCGLRTYTWQSALSLLMGCLLLANLTVAQSLPPGFSVGKAQDGYETPTGMLFNSTGQQQFVWDKPGRVYVSVWNGSRYIRQPAPVLDISDEASNWGDLGLLSLCLDPNFDRNGLVYLFYMVDRHHLLHAGTADYSATKNEYFEASISRVTRYKFLTTNGLLTTDSTSRKVLLGETPSTGVPMLHQSHAGGTLLFGRDGTLLLSTGDNADFGSVDTGSDPQTYFQAALTDGIIRPNENVGAFRAQMVNSHCGKILRMDPVTGDGLPSNPFFDVSKPRSAQSRVWALGFRNPYRMTLQPNTGSANPADGNPGTLLVGDVGWGTWEDLHVVQRGGENAGWPLFEGLTEQPDYNAAAQTLENKDESNPATTSPASATNTCPKPFLTFADLLKQASNPASGTIAVTNPCTSQPLPGLQRRYVHSRPALDWNHTQDIARSPVFSGTAAVAQVISQTATTGTVGQPFRGNASTAGVYYTGTAFPPAWRNTYFFADFGANWIRAATLNPDGSMSQVRDFLPNGSTKGLVSVAMSPLDGALYYVAIYAGEVMKISYSTNRPPVAVASASSLTGTSPLSITFTGSASTDPDGDTLTYAWNFGDGTTATVANPTKVFSATAGRGYSVTLTVSDGKGLIDSKTLQVSLNNTAPTVHISSPANNASYPLDKASLYNLTAAVTDDVPTGITYAWQVTLRHNNHEHREPISHDISPTVTISPVGCDGETYYYFISLLVTDAGGLTAQDSVKIYPDCNSPKLAITGLTATTLTNAVRLNWINPTIPFDNVLVVAKPGSGFTNRPSELVYTANSSFTANGASFDDGKVLYQGVSTSLVVTGLTAGLPYYFRVFTRRGSAWTGGVEIRVIPGPLPTPPATLTITPNTCYRIVSRVSGKVLGVEDGDMTNGGVVRQRTDANQPWQRWQLAATSDGYYQVIATHSGKVLDVWWGLTTDGAGLQQWTYGGVNNQQWAIRRDGEGFYQFAARHSAKVLDVQGANQLEGGNVIQQTPNGTQAQQWRIEERTCLVATAPQLDPNACYQIQSRSSGKVLGVANGSPDDGALIRQYTSTSEPWQLWKLQRTDEDYYSITVLHTGKGIDVPNGSDKDDAPLEQWTFWGGSFQQWTILRNADGFFTFTNRNSGKLIDVRGANTNEGGELVQYQAHAGTSQQWRITPATCPVASGRLAASVTPPEQKHAFRLWPNPAQDYVLIDVRATAGRPTSIGLTDVAGRSLSQVQVNTLTDTPYSFSTATLPNGLYFISITPTGQPTTTTQLLIQR